MAIATENKTIGVAWELIASTAESVQIELISGGPVYYTYASAPPSATAKGKKLYIRDEMSANALTNNCYARSHSSYAYISIVKDT